MTPDPSHKTKYVICLPNVKIFQEAINACNQAIKLQPDDAEAWKTWLSVYTEPETLPARRARCTKLSLFPEGAPNSSNRLLRQLTEPLFSSPWEACAPLVARNLFNGAKETRDIFHVSRKFFGNFGRQF